MLEVVYKKTNSLIPYSRNSRTHSDEQVRQIVESIKEFGFTNPILIDEKNEIIAGHGRLMASQQLKMEEVPCIVLSGLTDAQKKALVIADNRIAEQAGWDEDLLKLELISLDEMGFDYSDLGFDFEFDEIDNINFDNESCAPKEQQYKEKFLIIVDCKTEIEQQEIFYKLTNQGIECRVQSL